MNKPARVLAYVFAGVFLGVILILAIPIFTHSAYYLVSEALTFLLLGGLGISVGIILMQKVRAKGERIPWWKQSLIIIGMGYIGFAIFLFIKFNPNWTNNLFFDIVGFLMILLFFGLVGYGFVLMLLQNARMNNR